MDSPSRIERLEGRRSFSISEFQPNSFRLVQIRTDSEETIGDSVIMRPGEAWFLVRTSSEEFFAYRFPTWEDEIIMPKTYWGQFEGQCLQLDVTRNAGVIDSNSLLVCGELGDDRIFAEHWVWSLDGSNNSGMLPDLQRLEAHTLNGELVVINATYRRPIGL